MWALTCNPKLWQGRDRFTPKHYIPENVLLLTDKKLLTLVAYLVAESEIFCKEQSRDAAIRRMESRMDLLLHCMSTEDKLIANVVHYLVEQMMSCERFVISLNVRFCHN